MTAKEISGGIVIALAVQAAVIAAGLLAHQDMWAHICAYWIVLTIKNLVDIRGSKA